MKSQLGMRCSPLLALWLALSAPAFAQTNRVVVPDPQDWRMNARGNFAGHIERPLRYVPIGTDFVITNSTEFFNRPLYCLNSPFRIDGGDKPEFSLYLPGRGGNLRLGIKTVAGVKWLNDAERIVARYRPGSMIYEITDSRWQENGALQLSVLPLSTTKGFILRAEMNAVREPVELVWAFGGANGMRGSRGGDIGCEREPVSQFFQLRPEQCRDNEISVATNTFVLKGKNATLRAVASPGASHAIADARHWENGAELLRSAGTTHELPVVVGRIQLAPEQPVYLALQQLGADEELIAAANLPGLFAAAEKHRREIAERVTVETPDPFINAAAAALNVAADAVWDEKQQSFMHGAVAWRTRLLGWRGAYAGDELGWHDRTAQHFRGFARQQNTNAIPAAIPPADENVNLARNEAGLHSNGDLTKSHYDMNLVAVDAFFRHLMWTGDLNYARELWPVIERHLAWERRLFRREFGPERLPLYEAYAAIWASDDLQYNGGGAAHASAYNYWHNKMAARVAKLLGKDPVPYEREADLIAKAMRKYLWLADDGWFAECRDYLGLQLAHPNAGLWTFYHTLDSAVPTPFEAWQMTRFVDTQIPHIPIRLPNLETNLCTLSETSWMPYLWSINNVVMAEVAHTSLGYWQANRPEAAFPVFKGCLMDSMFLGLCPGNVGAMTGFDMARGEAQRDFADSCGATSRALVEGLFGVQPDALAGELKIKPGFPAQWNHASLQHPDFSFAFRREGLSETYSVTQKFARPMSLRLRIPALRETVEHVTVNGQPAKWQIVEDSVGWPKIEIISPPGARQNVVVVWRGRSPGEVRAPATVMSGERFESQFGTGRILAIQDPQNALSKLERDEQGFHGRASGKVGERTVFAQVRQGDLQWWQPVSFTIRSAEVVPSIDWKARVSSDEKFEAIDLSRFFNDRVTQIFRNEYRAPRSPFVSLSLPKQGIGAWCDFNTQFEVDDTGLRAASAQGGGEIQLPNGIPLRTPETAEAKNVIFTSQWNNYPSEVAVPLQGKSAHAYLLMAGSTGPMQSRFDNGEVVFHYTDGTSARLALNNPVNWWPIDQDYFLDDYAFRRDEPIPPRVDLRTGEIRLLDVASFKGRGGKIPGGAATVLDLPLDRSKELKSLTVRALANEVVIGLMSMTLAR